MKLTERQLQQRHEYAQLREKVYDRTRRLEQAGFKGYTAPRIRDLEPNQIGKEIKKIEKWLGSEGGTVRGARAMAARKEVEAAERAERRREQQREYRQRKAEREGREFKPRPPKNEEERKLAKRESNRRYRERERERREDIKQGLEKMRRENPKGAQALQNLQKGLEKFGIKIKNFDELKAWGEYFGKRSQMPDVKKKEYESDRWIEELLNTEGQSLDDKGRKEISSDAIYDLLQGFEEFKADQSALMEMFNDMTGDFSSEFFSLYFMR